MERGIEAFPGAGRQSVIEPRVRHGRCRHDGLMFGENARQILDVFTPLQGRNLGP